MEYKITQNPEFGNSEKAVNAFILHHGEDYRGNRNLAGLGHLLRGKETEIDSKSFTDKHLKQRLETYLSKRNIKYEIV